MKIVDGSVGGKFEGVVRCENSGGWGGKLKEGRGWSRGKG